MLRLHHDERGSVSLVTVFSLMLLTMLLGMVINTSRQVDSKVRLQNAADAATYSGGVVIARGMNGLAFTNHMISDVFALTAFLREARDGNAASLTPQVLTAWSNIAPVLESSEFPKFKALGQAIPEKVRLEQEMILRYSEWMASISALVLPVFEQILAEEAIPQYQRALIAGTPLQAQIAVSEIAYRHGDAVSNRDASRGPLAGLLWRTMLMPVSGESEMVRTTLPVVDPASDEGLQTNGLRRRARTRRNSLAHTYLDHWDNEYMQPFDAEAKMSQFGQLWRGFTCGQLERLLKDEYPDTNLPMMIRPLPTGVAAGQVQATANVVLDTDYNFVGVTYWPPLTEAMPGIFTSPVQVEHQAYAQGTLFIPTRRLVLANSGDPYSQLGFYRYWYWVGRQNRPTEWDLWNQNWNFQLVPATTEALPQILSQDPSDAGIPTVPERRYYPPNLTDMTGQQMQTLNSH